MRHDWGFSTVEMLIASAITLVVLAGTMGAFNNSLGLNEKAAQIADLEQNMRAGMNLLVDDFLIAGWSVPIGGIPIPSGPGAHAVVRPGRPEENIYFTAQTIAAVNPGPALGPVINGRQTDIVNILFMDSLLALNEWPLAAINANGSVVTVNAGTHISNVNNAIHAGDLIALSNAKGCTVQYVTGVAGQVITFGADDPMKLNQPDADYGSIKNLRNDDGTTFPPTTATRVWLVTYYLDSVTDPASPRLIRRINYGQGQAVALVLEDLQLSYDLVDGGANPANVKIPVAPNGPSQIRKANILLSGRSNSTARDTSEYFRRTLTTQAGLRSLSYVDRY
jgi:hypothetical protein